MLVGLTDGWALRRMRRGDAEAFGVLVRRHTPAVYAVAFAHVGNRADAEDIVQDTFIKALGAVDQVRDPGAVRAWLTAIARNTARTWLSRRAREGAVVEAAAQEAPSPISPSAVLERRELVDVHLTELDEGQREILMLRYYAGLSVREIALALELEAPAVRKRMQRAREALGRQVLRGLTLPGESEESARLRGRVLAVLGIPAAGWRDGLPAWAAGTGAKAVIGALSVGVIATVAAVLAPDPGDGGAAAPIVLAQAETGEASPPSASDGEPGPGPAETPSVAEIVGRVLAREVRVDASDRPIGEVSGRVLTESGEPVAEAAIRAERITWPAEDPGPTERSLFETTTDGDGTFALKDLPPGSYGISASTDELFGTMGVSVASPRPLRVDIEARPALPLSGTVRDEDGVVVAGAVLYLEHFERGQGEERLRGPAVTMLRTYSDHEGRFVFEQVYKANWTVLTKAAGYASEYTGPVAAGTTDAEVVLGKGGRLSGTATHLASGEAAAGLPLVLTGGGARLRQRTTTDGSGAFSFGHVRAGAYQILPDDPVLTSTPDSATATVVAGRDTDGVVVRVREGGRISGGVYDRETKEGLAGVQVLSRPRGAVGLSRETVTGSDGRYELVGLGEGTHAVDAAPPKGYRLPSAAFSVTLKPLAVALDGPSPTRDFEFERYAELLGRVIDEAGSPVAGAVVVSQGRDVLGGGDWGTTSEADGFFTMEVSPAARDIQLWAREGDRVSSTTTIAEVPAASPLYELVLEPAAQISGIVVDGSGRPVAGARVRPYTPVTHYDLSVLSGDDGRFIVTGLRAGEYAIYAVRPEADQGYHEDPRSIPNQLTLEQGERVEGLTIPLEEGGRVAGLVVDADGHPLSGAEINCNGSTLLSDDGGAFVCEGIQGEWTRMYVSKEGLVPKQINQIPVGTEDLIVTLVQKPRIAGVVVDARSGEPLTQVRIGANQYEGRPLTMQSITYMESRILEKGTFEFSELEPGTSQLLVSAEGYAISVTTLTLQPGESRTNLRIALKPAEACDVVVTDPNGTPVSGAEIYFGQVFNATYAGKMSLGLTDETGTFVLPTYVEGGGGLVSAYHRTWSIGRGTVPSDGKGTIPIQLGPPRGISGQVTVSGAIPPPGAVRVAVITEHRDTVDGWNQAAGPDGGFRFENVPAGPWTLQVWLTNSSDQDRWAFDRPIGPDETEVNVDIPLGTAAYSGTMDPDVGEFRDAAVVIAQPQIVPGLEHRYWLGSVVRDYRFERLFPGPAEVRYEVQHPTGESDVVGPFAVTVP